MALYVKSDKKYMNHNDNKLHYFVYKTTNLTNGKFYIGVHGAYSLNDQYLGSGITLRRAVMKYGSTNFKREILQEFTSYDECYEYEKQLVTQELIDSGQVYNLVTGGNGSRKMSAEVCEKNRVIALNKWKENREYMMSTVHSKQSCKRKSDAIKKYISENQDEFQAKMNRINKDPVKIKKTSDKHRGMKRTTESKQRMSDSRKQMLTNNKHLVGSGMKYVTDMSTMTLKRVPCDYILLDNEVFGNKVKKTSKEAAGLGMKFVTDMSTGKQFKVAGDYVLQGNEVFGRKKLE